MERFLLRGLQLPVLHLVELFVGDAQIGEGARAVLVVKQHLVVELARLEAGERVHHQEDEDQAADQVRPDVYCLVVDHEQTLGQLGVVVEVDAIARHYVFVVEHEGVGILERADETRLLG